MENRFYKAQVTDPSILDIDSTLIELDNTSWRRPRVMTVRNVGKLIQLRFNDEVLRERNMTSLEFSGQDVSCDSLPDDARIVGKSFIAIGENHMYVWIESLKRWKRIMLTEW